MNDINVSMIVSIKQQCVSSIDARYLRGTFAFLHGMKGDEDDVV